VLVSTADGAIRTVHVTDDTNLAGTTSVVYVRRERSGTMIDLEAEARRHRAESQRILAESADLVERLKTVDLWISYDQNIDILYVSFGAFERGDAQSYRWILAPAGSRRGRLGDHGGRADGREGAAPNVSGARAARAAGGASVRR
jgi:hypothetical protein